MLAQPRDGPVLSLSARSAVATSRAANDAHRRAAKGLAALGTRRVVYNSIRHCGYLRGVSRLRLLKQRGGFLVGRFYPMTRTTKCSRCGEVYPLGTTHICRVEGWLVSLDPGLSGNIQSNPPSYA